MTNIPFVTSDYRRSVADSPFLYVRNRFVEENPSLNDNQTSFISRPGLQKFVEIGTGPIRRVFTSEGNFKNCLFVVSGLFLWRLETDGTFHQIGQISQVLTDAVSMCATGTIGDNVPAFLYIADGGLLWYYTDNGQATANLNATGTIANNDVVQVDSTWYKFTNGSVDAGSPAGTSADPWLVMLGLTTAESLTELFYAINASGVAGTDYSTGLQENPTVSAYSSDTTDLFVEYDTFGTAGNTAVVSTTSTAMAWTTSTLTGGGDEELRQVQVPEDSGAISVGYINSYTIVVPVQSEGIVGRFYWIQPGENTIDPLDYATAERSPDAITQVVVLNDMFWLLKQISSEAWVTTGIQATPMERYQGILYDRGCWPDTACLIKDSIVLVDENGAVFQIQGGQTRISTPAIEERIRLALQRQGFSPTL